MVHRVLELTKIESLGPKTTGTQSCSQHILTNRHYYELPYMGSDPKCLVTGNQLMLVKTKTQEDDAVCCTREQDTSYSRERTSPSTGSSRHSLCPTLPIFCHSPELGHRIILGYKYWFPVTRRPERWPLILNWRKWVQESLWFGCLTGAGLRTMYGH